MLIVAAFPRRLPTGLIAAVAAVTRTRICEVRFLRRAHSSDRDARWGRSSAYVVLVVGCLVFEFLQRKLRKWWWLCYSRFGGAIWTGTFPEVGSPLNTTASPLCLSQSAVIIEPRTKGLGTGGGGDRKPGEKSHSHKAIFSIHTSSVLIQNDFWNLTACSTTVRLSGPLIYRARLVFCNVRVLFVLHTYFTYININMTCGFVHLQRSLGPRLIKLFGFCGYCIKVDCYFPVLQCVKRRFRLTQMQPGFFCRNPLLRSSSIPHHHQHH